MGTLPGGTRVSLARAGLGPLTGPGPRQECSWCLPGLCSRGNCSQGKLGVSLPRPVLTPPSLCPAELPPGGLGHCKGQEWGHCRRWPRGHCTGWKWGHWGWGHCRNWHATGVPTWGAPGHPSPSAASGVAGGGQSPVSPCSGVSWGSLCPVAGDGSSEGPVAFAAGLATPSPPPGTCWRAAGSDRKSVV